MKKILAYTLVAVFLGVVTMLAPFAPFVSKMGTTQMDTYAERSAYVSITEFMQKAPSETEQTYGITVATYPLDILFIAFMLVLSFAIAFGVMRHFMRKTIL